MKKIKANGIPAFHGELSVRAISALPETAEASDAVLRPDGAQVIGHSETGHHHVASAGKYYRDTENPLLAYLVTNGPVTIEHEKASHDKHDTFELLGGSGPEVVWEIGNAREWSPKGWQRAID